MKKSILFALSLVLLSTSLFAQKDETLFGRTGLKFSGAWGGPTVGLTAFDDDFAVVKGGYGGIEFGKSVFIGWGGFHIADDYTFDANNTSRLELSYNGLMVGYAPKAHRTIHPQFNLLVGSGNAKVEGKKDNLLVVQPSAGFEVNVLRWFRFGIEGGYRFSTGSDLPDIQDKDLSAFYGEAKFKFGISWGK